MKLFNIQGSLKTKYLTKTQMPEEQAPFLLMYMIVILTGSWSSHPFKTFYGLMVINYPNYFH